MIAAIIMVHGKHGLFMNWFGDQKGHGIEYHLLALALATYCSTYCAGIRRTYHAEEPGFENELLRQPPSRSDKLEGSR
jgi:hypothetical protein